MTLTAETSWRVAGRERLLVAVLWPPCGRHAGASHPWLPCREKRRRLFPSSRAIVSPTTHRASDESMHDARAQLRPRARYSTVPGRKCPWAYCAQELAVKLLTRRVARSARVANTGKDADGLHLRHRQLSSRRSSSGAGGTAQRLTCQAGHGRCRTPSVGRGRDGSGSPQRSVIPKLSPARGPSGAPGPDRRSSPDAG